MRPRKTSSSSSTLPSTTAIPLQDTVSDDRGNARMVRYTGYMMRQGEIRTVRCRSAMECGCRPPRIRRFPDPPCLPLMAQPCSLMGRDRVLGSQGQRKRALRARIRSHNLRGTPKGTRFGHDMLCRCQFLSASAPRLKLDTLAEQLNARLAGPKSLKRFGQLFRPCHLQVLTALLPCMAPPRLSMGRDPCQSAKCDFLGD